VGYVFYARSVVSTTTCPIELNELCAWNEQCCPHLQNQNSPREVLSARSRSLGGEDTGMNIDRVWGVRVSGERRE